MENNQIAEDHVLDPDDSEIRRPSDIQEGGQESDTHSFFCRDNKPPSGREVAALTESAQNTKSGEGVHGPQL